MVNQSERVLEYCDPEFAQDWRLIGQMHSIASSSFGAAAVMTLHPDDSLHIVLRAQGFDELFGTDFACTAGDHAMLITMHDRAPFLHMCRKAAESGTATSMRCSWRQKHPEVKGSDLICTGAIVQKVGETPEGGIVLYVLLRDLTERSGKRAELTRSQLATALRLVYAEVSLIDIDSGVVTPIHLDGRDLHDAKPCACSDAGLHKLFTSLHPEDKRDFWKFANMSNIERALFNPSQEEDAVITADLRRMGSDGEYHWVTMEIFKVVYDDNRRTVLLCQRNIDEQKEAQRRERDLRSRAQLDALTGIFNRGTTEELISAMLQGKGADESYLFAVFDVDNFKGVNDTYGHLMGDKLLKCVADSIRSICRERDIVGRIGGDEFVALFSGKATEGIDSLQERLATCMEKVAEFSAEQNVDPLVTLSIGLAAVPDGAITYHEVFALADETLYKVKKGGKNGFELHAL